MAKPSVAAFDALGAWFGERHQISCAVGAFESAVRMDPHSWEAQHNLALALLQLHKPSDAVQHLSLTVRAKPDLLPAHNALRTVLLDAGELPDAEREFREVLKLDAKNVYALDHLAQVLSSQHRYVASRIGIRRSPFSQATQIWRAPWPWPTHRMEIPSRPS